MIVAGYSGVGKTTFAKAHQNVIDLHVMPYKYSNLSKLNTKYNDESIKAAPELIIESEFYKINDFEYSAEGKRENLVLLSCVEIAVISQDDLQGDTYNDKIGIGSIVKIVGEDNVGIIKEIVDASITVDIYYEKDNYLVEPHQKSANHSNILLANGDDFRVGYRRYLSCREYLHIYSKRDKGRMSAVLHQVKKAWETYPDLRLGQLLMGCCANDSVMFGIEDEILMEQLHKVYLDRN